MGNAVSLIRTKGGSLKGSREEGYRCGASWNCGHWMHEQKAGGQGCRGAQHTHSDDSTGSSSALGPCTATSDYKMIYSGCILCNHRAHSSGALSLTSTFAFCGARQSFGPITGLSLMPLERNVPPPCSTCIGSLWATGQQASRRLMGTITSYQKEG
jgi:hypothetical protein